MALALRRLPGRTVWTNARAGRPVSIPTWCRRLSASGTLDTVTSYTSALLLPTLSPLWVEGFEIEPSAAEERREVVVEAIRWQALSSFAAIAEGLAHSVPFRRTLKTNGVVHVIDPSTDTPPRCANRILEIHGIAGAVGEQLGLAWTAEQDAQRVETSRASRDPEHLTLMLRAQSELVGHFVLGAAHGLANCVLRLALLDTEGPGRDSNATSRQRSRRRATTGSRGPLSTRNWFGCCVVPLQTTRTKLSPGWSRRLAASKLMPTSPNSTAGAGWTTTDAAHSRYLTRQDVAALWRRLQLGRG